MSRSAYTTGLVALICGGTILFISYFVISGMARGTFFYIIVAAAIFFLGLLFVQLRGWQHTPEVLVGSLIVVSVLTASPEYLQSNLSISVLMPAVVAAALLSPIWVFVAFALTMLGSFVNVAVQRGFTAEALGPTARFENLLVLTMVAIGVGVASSLSWHLQRQASESARTAQEERDQVELKSRELTDANLQMNQQIIQQRQLLDLVATLETPAVQLAEGVLFTPIVGHIDTRRAQALTTRLLRDVNAQRARLVILDVSGVTVMDTSVAQALLNTTKALRLLGCDVTLSGISASVALTLTDLGINLDEVRTVRSPQEALSLFTPTSSILGNGKAAFA